MWFDCKTKVWVTFHWLRTSFFQIDMMAGCRGPFLAVLLTPESYPSAPLIHFVFTAIAARPWQPKEAAKRSLIAYGMFPQSLFF